MANGNHGNHGSVGGAAASVKASVVGVGAAAVTVRRDLEEMLGGGDDDNENGGGGVVERACRDVGHRWRRRLLTPALTVRLLLLQLLAKLALAGLSAAGRVTASAQAIGKARMRLPLAVWMRLVELSGGTSSSPSSSGADQDRRWRGHRVFMADGMSFMTADTRELSRRYGKGANQRGGSHSYPVPKLLALLDRASGMITKVIALPHARQEHTCLGRLLACLDRGDLVLGDRGLVSFAHLAMVLGAGVHACMRLPSKLVVRGRGKGNRRRARCLGKGDLLVTWRRRGAVKPAWMSRRRFDDLPESITLRQVAYRVHRPGFRVRWAWLVTTLIDAAAYPAAELVELYGTRWHAEVCFRDLKSTLGMGRVLSARTVAGVRKECWRSCCCTTWYGGSCATRRRPRESTPTASASPTPPGGCCGRRPALRCPGCGSTRDVTTARLIPGD